MPNEEDDVTTQDSITQFEEFLEEAVVANIQEDDRDVESAAG